MSDERSRATRWSWGGCQRSRPATSDLVLRSVRGPFVERVIAEPRPTRYCWLGVVDGQRPGRGTRSPRDSRRPPCIRGRRRTRRHEPHLPAHRRCRRTHHTLIPTHGWRRASLQTWGRRPSGIQFLSPPPLPRGRRTCAGSAYASLRRAASPRRSTQGPRAIRCAALLALFRQRPAGEVPCVLPGHSAKADQELIARVRPMRALDQPDIAGGRMAGAWRSGGLRDRARLRLLGQNSPSWRRACDWDRLFHRLLYPRQEDTAREARRIVCGAPPHFVGRPKARERFDAQRLALFRQRPAGEAPRVLLDQGQRDREVMARVRTVRALDQPDIGGGQMAGAWRSGGLRDGARPRSLGQKSPTRRASAAAWAPKARGCTKASGRRTAEEAFVARSAARAPAGAQSPWRPRTRCAPAPSDRSEAY